MNILVCTRKNKTPEELVCEHEAKLSIQNTPGLDIGRLDIDSELNWKMLASVNGGFNGALKCVGNMYDMYVFILHGEANEKGGFVSKGQFSVLEHAASSGKGVFFWGGSSVGAVQVKKAEITNAADWSDNYAAIGS